jgi:Fe-Mn family superoxide dismutase
MTNNKKKSLTRRDLVTGAAALAAMSRVGSARSPAQDAAGAAAPAAARRDGGPIELMKLPYEDNALDPVISAKTVSFHYGKHHKGYVDKLNELLSKEPELAKKKLDEIVMAVAGKQDKRAIFNNAAQIWNHDFYWKSLKPKGGGKPSGEVAERIDKDCGGYDKLRQDLVDGAMTQFGSGWVWLVVLNGKLGILKTGNADVPMMVGGKPLLTIDVWEHAYYLDYQNLRKKYAEEVIDKLLNWEFAAQNLAAAR